MKQTETVQAMPTVTNVHPHQGEELGTASPSRKRNRRRRLAGW